MTNKCFNTCNDWFYANFVWDYSMTIIMILLEVFYGSGQLNNINIIWYYYICQSFCLHKFLKLRTTSPTVFTFFELSISYNIYYESLILFVLSFLSALKTDDGCYLISDYTCQLSYNTTMLPNVFGHTDLNTIQYQLMGLNQLMYQSYYVPSACVTPIMQLSCEMMYPKCENGTTEQICRNSCMGLLNILFKPFEIMTVD